MRCDIGVVGYRVYRMQSVRRRDYISRIALGRAAVESDSLVRENIVFSIFIFPSTAEHVKFRRNLSRPWDKAKYYLMTDSELVP